MNDETLFAHETPSASKKPSASKRKTPVLPVCCICGFIRDEIKASPDSERWVTQRTYRNTHGVNLAHCLLTHTYCPKCFLQAMDRIKVA